MNNIFVFRWYKVKVNQYVMSNCFNLLYLCSLYVAGIQMCRLKSGIVTVARLSKRHNDKIKLAKNGKCLKS